MVYEDLRPGSLACCLFSCPVSVVCDDSALAIRVNKLLFWLIMLFQQPLIAFAPIFCPILSATSKAFHFSFDLNPKTSHFDLIMRSKAFACGETSRTFASVSYMQLNTIHRAHAALDSRGAYSDSRATTHDVVVYFEDGAFTLPPLPQHDLSVLQALVAAVLRLVRPSSCFRERDEGTPMSELRAGCRTGKEGDEEHEPSCIVVVPATAVVDCFATSNTLAQAQNYNNNIVSNGKPHTIIETGSANCEETFEVSVADIVVFDTPRH